MGAHLHADIQHDGQTTVTSNKRVQKLWLPHPTFPLNVSDIENKVVELFNTQGPQVNREQRKQSRIDFIIRAKTDAFRSDTMSPFHPFGDAPNSQIAIIQDAGSHLFKAMHESWNLLVPGSCIDPAGKPIHKEDNPVWVKPVINQMSIPACVFGFDSNVVGTLIWKDFKGLSVVFGFQYNGGGEMLWYDAGKGDIRGGTNFSSVTQPKIINKLSGFLLSNGEIEKDFKVGNPNPRIQLVIGKALGDAMQALGSVDGISTRTKWTNPTGGKRKRRTTLRKHQRGGAPPNPAFPSDGSIYGHVGPRVPKSDEIKYVILNTGDRLEGVRAEEEGAAYVYGHPIERNNPIQTLFFVPGEVGTIDTAQLIDQSKARLTKVFSDMTQSFDLVIANMSKALSSGSFDPQYSYLEGTAYVNQETNELATELATQFMRAAIASVTAVSNAMKQFYTKEFNKLQTTINNPDTDESEKLKFINESYKQWNARAGLYAPSTTAILTKSGNIIRTHPILQLPKGVRIDTGGTAGKTAEKVLEGSFTIYYADVLQAIRSKNENAVTARTPNWGVPPPTQSQPPVEALPMQGGAPLYDSLETETLYNEATGPSNRMFNELSQLPKVYDFTAALNAFSCYLNKHNACRFVVDPTYETPTPEEIQVVRAGGHSDTFSTAAYYAFQEEEYLKTVQKPQLPALPFNIVSEFTGPLRLFADYMGVSVNEASVMFMNVNKSTCIDETLYDTIQYDLWFCMADSVPMEETISSVEVPMTQEVQESKENDDLSGYETAAIENEFVKAKKVGPEQESKEMDMDQESMKTAFVPPQKSTSLPMFMKTEPIKRTTSADLPMVPREPLKRRRGSDFMRRIEPETKRQNSAPIVHGGRTFRRRLPKLI